MTSGKSAQLSEACEAVVSHRVRHEKPMKSTVVRYVRHLWATRPCVRMRVRARTPVCTCARLHASHTSHAAHANADKHLRACPCPTPSPTHLTKGSWNEHSKAEAPRTVQAMGMDVLPVVASTRVICCDESNAPDFAALVNSWPELKALVRDLRAADLFPGLRGMQVTLTGAPEWTAQGMSAAIALRANNAAGDAHAG